MAGIYLLFSRLIQVMGRGSSVIQPWMYPSVFCGCDVLAFFLQALGNGLNLLAVRRVGQTMLFDGYVYLRTGTNLMLTSLALQLCSVGVFAIFALDNVRRARHHDDMRTFRVWALLVVMFLPLTSIGIRNAFLTIMLGLQSWQNLYFEINGLTLFACNFITIMIIPVLFNFCHPGWLLPQEPVLEIMEKKLLDLPEFEFEVSRPNWGPSRVAEV